MEALQSDFPDKIISSATGQLCGLHHVHWSPLAFEQLTTLQASNNPSVLSLVPVGREYRHGSSVPGLTDQKQGAGQPAVLIWSLGASSRLIQVDDRIQLLLGKGLTGPVPLWGVNKRCSQLLQAPLRS